MEWIYKYLDSCAAPSGFHSGFRILAFDDDDDDDDDLPWPNKTAKTTDDSLIQWATPLAAELLKRFAYHIDRIKKINFC